MSDKDNKPGKLDPLPTPIYPKKKGWDDLNKWVQKNFPKERISDATLGLPLRHTDYDLKKEDIISELESIGLHVRDHHSDNHIFVSENL